MFTWRDLGKKASDTLNRGFYTSGYTLEHKAVANDGAKIDVKVQGATGSALKGTYKHNKKVHDEYGVSVEAELSSSKEYTGKVVVDPKDQSGDFSVGFNFKAQKAVDLGDGKQGIIPEEHNVLLDGSYRHEDVANVNVSISHDLQGGQPTCVSANLVGTVTPNIRLGCTATAKTTPEGFGIDNFGGKLDFRSNGAELTAGYESSIDKVTKAPQQLVSASFYYTPFVGYSLAVNNSIDLNDLHKPPQFSVGIEKGPTKAALDVTNNQLLLAHICPINANTNLTFGLKANPTNPLGDPANSVGVGLSLTF